MPGKGPIWGSPGEGRVADKSVKNVQLCSTFLVGRVPLGSRFGVRVWGGPGTFGIPWRKHVRFRGGPFGHNFWLRFGVVLGTLGDPPPEALGATPKQRRSKSESKTGSRAGSSCRQFYTLHMEGSPFGGRSGPHGFPGGADLWCTDIVRNPTCSGRAPPPYTLPRQSLPRRTQS